MALHVTRYKPSSNAYNALEKSLLPRNNYTPSVNYPFISQLSKQYHLLKGIDSFNIEVPWGNRIPEKLFFVLQTHDAFNTRDFAYNGLYLSHLNLSNVYITINASTIYNVSMDFESGNVSEIHHLHVHVP